eukprot:6932062-Pyramimonas_sp.AAC.1
MLSRSGCKVHQNIITPASQFPVKLFKMLQDPSLADGFEKEPVCPRGSFTDAFIKAHPGEDLSGRDAIQKLHLIAKVSHLESVAQESGHAKTRRRLVGQS